MFNGRKILTFNRQGLLLRLEDDEVKLMAVRQELVKWRSRTLLFIPFQGPNSGTSGSENCQNNLTQTGDRNGDYHFGPAGTLVLLRIYLLWIVSLWLSC